MDRLEKQAVSYSQFACIGSGFSAIGLGATLKRWHGITDVRFFERNSDLGGTWFINSYPGCACDVPSVLYSFSFAPNPKWTRVLPTAAELWTYLRQVADDYGLLSKITFGARVERCEWLQDTRRWRLHVRNVADGRVLVHESQFLFSGTGILVEPREPDMPGIESFDGPVVHAGRWRPDVALDGKAVAVIGNGCTAAQMIPAIVAQTAQLHQYTRTKHWIIPPVDVPHSERIQWLFEHVPGLLRLCRFLAYLVTENDLRGFYMTAAGARFRERSAAWATRYIRKTAPAKYHDLLIPDFEIGCKRRIFDPGYLKALHAPNLTVTDNPIAEVLPDAIRTEDGTTTKADVIILANGYATNQFMPGIDVVGRGGVTLEQHWSTLGGPGAYNCCAIHEFPNFFMILGPNTTTGHSSTIMAIENAINYALRIIRPVLDGDATTVEVKPEAEEQYSRQLQDALHKTVWWTGCTNWYNKEGPDGKKWNAMTYPHSQMHYWFKCLFPVYRDWNYTMTPQAPRRRFVRRASKAVRWTGLLIFVLGISLAVQKNGLDGNKYTSMLLQAFQSLRQRLHW